jgi:50S ribosomal protein L16 3-hydroxylase
VFDLDALVAPTSAEAFVREYWPTRPGHFAANPAKLDTLFDEVPELMSGSEILTRFTDRVSILRPDGFYANVSDGVSALPFYSAEYTCFLRSVERFLPALESVVSGLASSLGMPRSAFSCDIFASTGRNTSSYEHASGLAVHSDAEVSLALLITGRKRWRWAPNSHIKNQTTTVVRDGDRQVDASQLELADKLPMPHRMPPDAETADVKPGGLIFLPRGWWHTTTALGQCLQLNFTMHGPTWIEVFLNSLSTRLTHNPHWREYAYGIAGTEEQRSEARLAIGALIKDLGGSLRTERTVEELLDAIFAFQSSS